MEKALEIFSRTDAGAFLNEFDYKSVQIEELPFQKEGLVTAYYTVFGDKVRIAPDDNESVYFGVLVHELYHVYQRYKYGLLPYLLLKAFFRCFLEKGAEDAELKAVEWYGMNGGKIC